MTDITDKEASEIMWAGSDRGKAAVRAAWDKAQDLDHDNRAWATVRLTENEVTAIVHAAFLAAGRDAPPLAAVDEVLVSADETGVEQCPACGCELLHPEPICQDCGAPTGDEEG